MPHEAGKGAEGGGQPGRPGEAGGGVAGGRLQEEGCGLQRARGTRQVPRAEGQAAAGPEGLHLLSGVLSCSPLSVGAPGYCWEQQ